MLDRPRSRLLIWLAAYLAAGLFALALPREHGLVPWYPPLAVGIGILVAGGVRWWPLVLAVEVVGSMLALGAGAAVVLSISVPVAAEAALAAAMLRRWRLHFLRGDDALILAAVAVVAGTSGATLAVAATTAAGIPPADPIGFWLAWALCDVATITTLLPLALLVGLRHEGTFRIPRHRHREVEISLILAASVVTVMLTALVFTTATEPRGLFRVLWIIPIAWMAVRYERLLAALVAAVMSATAFGLLATNLVDLRPISVIGLQVSVAAVSTVGLLVAAALAGRRDATDRLADALAALEESESRYTQVFAEGAAIQFLVDPDTMRFLDVSEAAARFYGISRARMRDLAVPDIDPAPVEVIRARIARGAAEKGDLLVEHRRADGVLRTMEVIAGPVEIGGRRLVHAIARDATDEHAARVEVARLAAAVESSAEAIVTTDLDGCVTGWNAAAEGLFGHAAADALGRQVDDLLGDLETPPSDLAALVREGRAVRFGHVVRPPAGGEPVPVELVISPIVAGGEVIGMSRISHDLRPVLREQERVRRSEAMLADAAAIGHIGSWEIEPRTGRASWSDELHRITGVPPDEVVTARTLAELAHPDDRPRVLLALTGLSGAPLDFRLVTRDGRERTVVAGWRRLGAGDGDPGRVVGVLRDVTDERALEAQLRQAQRLESIGMLASGVAHDFNNLLTAIAGFADLARTVAASGGSPDDDLAQVEAAVERGRALTSQLLAFGRHSVARPRPVEVGRAVALLVPMLRRLLGEDISILTELETDAVAVVDPGQLDQLVLNLAINARDAMPDGGRLRLATGRVEADRESPVPGPGDGVRVWLEVEDDGHGIAPALLERVFEPFFTTKERGQGTGLGLATVQQIVAAAGGRIDVRSQVGQGTVFRVELPGIATLRAPEEPRARAEAATGEERILLVEDEALVRRVAQRVLERAGFRVISAANVPDALSLAARERPDLLVSDIVLPGIGDGVTLADELHARWPDLPVLLVTGYAERVPPAWASLLPKPYETADLVAEVRRLLDEAGAARGASPAGR